MMTRESARFEVFEWRSVSRDEFVRAWSGLYADPRERLYEDCIGAPYSDEDVRALFEWKNGGALSERKRRSVEENYVARLGEFGALPTDTPPDVFLERWSQGGAIWRIFWLHCWSPSRFPIFDQHAYRAAAYIGGWPRTEMPTSDLGRVASYLQEYLPFCVKHGLMEREHDKALWSYGKFLKSWASREGDAV